jgi:hypothetical protein
MKYLHGALFIGFSFFLLSSCQERSSGPSKDQIDQINLKRGDIISCGRSDNRFGTVDFEMTCNESVKSDFNLAIELLHSFEYDEAEKAFAIVINKAPECAMAYWGVAMSNFHPLWNPPTESELQKGAKAIAIANGIEKKSEREAGYIDAIAAFYNDWNKLGHHARCVNFEMAMEKLHLKYPDDKEAAIFYALALDAAAEPTDKSYANQKKAGAILNALYLAEPEHPGIIHYIIHTYDYPGLAILALPAAKKYAMVAPSSSHALHMPSHIFTRLGLWDECIKSNLVAVSAAECYTTSGGINGQGEELHGMDYLVYAYLQKGENGLAKEQVKKAENIEGGYPVDFKIAYAMAAIPSRYVLENKDWTGAAAVQLHPANYAWDKFPWQEAIVHFTRALGLTQLGKIDEAKTEINKLEQLHDVLEKQKDIYKSHQVATQVKTCEAWIRFQTGKKMEALNLMKLAADMEDSTEKHPVTPGEVLPARELLADMLFQMHQYENALSEYEAVLKKSPNRFNALYGAGQAAERSADHTKAAYYYKELLANTDLKNSDRTELAKVRMFFAGHKDLN